MTVVGLRELSRQTCQIVDRLETTGEPIVVTRQGQPIAALVAVDSSRLEDLILAAAPDYVDSTREADEALAAGNTRPMSMVLGDMTADADEASGLAEAQHPYKAAARVRVDTDPAVLVSTYRRLVDQVSAQVADREMPGADEAEIQLLQSVNADLFSEFVSTTLQRAVERVQIVNENAFSVGDPKRGFDTSLELIQNVKAAEILSHSPVVVGKTGLTEGAGGSSGR